MRFCERNLSTISKFSLKIYNTFTSSENLNFLSMSIYNACDVMNGGHMRRKKK